MKQQNRRQKANGLLDLPLEIYFIKQKTKFQVHNTPGKLPEAFIIIIIMEP